MRCDLAIEKRGPNSVQVICIRCRSRYSVQLVPRRVRTYTQCRAVGWGDRLETYFRSIGIKACGGCGRRQHWLNELGRKLYRRLWGPPNATYLEA